MSFTIDLWRFKMAKHSFAQIVSAIAANNGMVKDDHGNGTRMLKLAGVATLDKNERSTPVALCDSAYFSVNGVYLDEEGVPHVDISSVGGVVDCRNHASVKDAVEHYNEEQKGFPFSCGTLNNVTMF
jgi:hypothetical protein